MGTFDWHSDIDSTGLFEHEDGLAAFGLWIRAGTWTGGHGRTGFVGDAQLRELFGASDEIAGEVRLLVEVGLWEREEGGYRMLRGPHTDPDQPLPLWRYSDTDLDGRLFGVDDTPNN
ncbi:hypothetical protein [Jiangella anatolica]|uniref:Uncharacterized protein n=1 Tax=Jiangella anatolica TaxID=2670374 RepID=A0A2W2CKX4_9ACTN|nr:hypothetical protein [Jiangella anatolica]PZF86046.1 hypothetical protein C1I92_02335 [Jiangella anatolica]